MACLAACLLLSVALGAAVAIDIWPPIRTAGTRITFGKPATPRLLPYMAHILATNASTKHTRHCAGSLVTRDAVLTSAYCLRGSSKYFVRLGSIHRTAEDKNAWTAEAIWALRHPNYDYNSADNNLAIIYLPEKAPINDFIQLIDLPSPAAGSFIGSRGIVSGWGMTSPDSSVTEDLHWTEVTVFPNEMCREFFPDKFAITERSMCAASVTSSIYGGDYGAPLVLKSKGRYTQIGIFSNYLGSAYFNTSKPVNYARVTYFVDWIRLKTGLD